VALQVGELVAMLSVDDRAYGAGLRRAEGDLRASGDRMESDAERAGTAAGEALGEGLRRGADGRLRDVRGRFARAGAEAGEAMGDGLTEEAEQGADQAVDASAQRMERLKLVAAGIGAAAGAALMLAMGHAMEKERISDRLSAQLGATGAEAKRYGKVVGQMYAEALVADVQTAADAISAVMRAGILPTGATEQQIKIMSTRVNDLATTFDLDLGQTANAVGQILKTKIGRDGRHALDVLTRGMQKMGPRADDLMDTFNEYSVQFRQLGLSVDDAVGLMSQGLKAGARDTDVVADSMKEFVLQAQSGADTVKSAFKELGLSGDEMQRVFSEGGPKAREAFDQVLDRLRQVPDAGKRAELAVALFGTKSEDMQKALMALDVSHATEELGKVSGAADNMGKTLRDNAAHDLEQFKRKIEDKVVTFLGTEVIPVLNDFVEWTEENPEKFKTAATVIGGAMAVIGAAAIAMGLRTAAGWLLAMGPIGWAIAAVLALGVALWAFHDDIQRMVESVPAVMTTIGRSIVALTDDVLRALDPRRLVSRMTGWVTGVDDAGSGMALGLEGIKATAAGWLPRFFGVLSPMGSRLPSIMRMAVAGMRGGGESGVGGVLAWVRGLPGRAAAALGGIGGRLYSSGRALIGGFIAGIRSRVSEVAAAASAVVSAARAYFPFSPAKKGPFSGRGYTSYSGAALIRGFEDGITSRLPHLEATLAGLPAAPTYGVSPAGGYGGAGGAYGAGGAAAAPTVLEIRSDGTALGDALVGVLQKTINARGGNAQLVLTGRP
jgi:phage-related minor tail protein